MLDEANGTNGSDEVRKVELWGLEEAKRAGTRKKRRQVKNNNRRR
jgi:hypothetical protein